MYEQVDCTTRLTRGPKSVKPGVLSLVIGYAQKEVFSAFELERLSLAAKLVDQLPAMVLGDEDWIRCHELTRAVGPLLGLPWCDGHYGMVEHSWLWTKPLEPFSPPPNIIDLYCPGRLPQVQLVHSSSHLPYEYRRSSSRDDIRPTVVEYLTKALNDLSRS